VVKKLFLETASTNLLSWMGLRKTLEVVELWLNWRSPEAR